MAAEDADAGEHLPNANPHDIDPLTRARMRRALWFFGSFVAVLWIVIIVLVVAYG